MPDLYTPAFDCAARNETVNPRSRAPVLERNVLEAPASSENPGRQEPPEQRVPRREPRNKDIKSDCVKYNGRRGTAEF